MKEKIESNKDKCFQYHPPQKISGSDRKKEQTKIELRHLDEKIVGIINFLNDLNFERAKKFGVSQESIKGLAVIKKILLKLIPLIGDSKKEIITTSHLSDRLGNFQGCLGMAERIVEKKKDENINEKLITMFEDQIARYRNYFSECLMKEDFLEKELSDKEGVEIH